MPVREISPDETVLPIQPQVRELQPDEEVIMPSREDVGDVRFEGSQPGEEFGGVESFGRGANVGIAKGFGAVSDFSNFLSSFVGLGVEEPPGGSRQIQRGFAALGIAPAPGQADPDTILGSAGRVVGESAPFLFGVGPAAKLSTGVAMKTRPPPTSVAGRIVQDIGESAVTKPGRFIASEVAGAAGAGVGGFIAREKFPDSPAAETIGMILGGLTPATALTAGKLVPTLTGINLARRMGRPFTQAGGTARARQRVGEISRDIEQAQGELGADDLPEARLTPAQRTGDEGLLSLERAIIESSEQLKGQSDEQIAQATAIIRQSLQDIGEGAPVEITAEALEEARGYVLSLAETRMRIAVRQADEMIGELAPTATREEANLIVRDELEKALKDIRAQETDLWNLVPERVRLPTSRATEAFGKIVADTPRAQREDIPEIARQFLDPESNRFVGAEETVKELQGLRSKLLEESRKARAAGDFNTARISNELADAILDDLGAQREKITGEAGEALRTALDFSADLNQKFTQGPVGKLLGSESRGGPRVARELTLETTTAKGGPRARVETRAILEASDTPELRGAVEDFLLDDFQRRVIREGRIGQKKAETFLARHTDVLEDFPELRSRMETAIEADDAAAFLSARAEGLAKRLNDPKVSRAAVFLKEPIESAMDRVARSPKPDKTMRELVKQANRDTTGDAVNGLKTGFADLLLRQSSTGTITKTGQQVLSGRAMKRLLNEGPTSKMFKALFSPQEQQRIRGIADVAEKVEKAISAKPAKGGVVSDAPSLIFSTMARIFGAQVGRQIATATGGGTVQTPGLMAGFFQRALNSARSRVGDPAERLLIDAMKDEKLLDALMRETFTPGDQKFIRKQLNAWLLSVGVEQIPDEGD